MPTKKCCCVTPGCHIGSDQFDRPDENPVSGDWIEVGGDWAVASNRLTGGGGPLITTLRQQAPVDGSQYTYRIIFTVHGGGPWHIICKFIDETNFDWIELTDVGVDQYAPKFWRRVGGTDILILNPDDYPASPRLSLSSFQGTAFSICYSAVEWNISGLGEFRWTSCSGEPATSLPTPPHGFVGFLEGTFDSFLYDIHWESDRTCFQCGCFCSDGVNGNDRKCIPEELVLTLTPVVIHPECTTGPPTLVFPMIQSRPANTPDPPTPGLTFDKTADKQFWYSTVAGPFTNGWRWVWFRLECIGFGQFVLRILQYPTGPSTAPQNMEQSLIRWKDFDPLAEGAIPTHVECTPIILTFPRFEKALLQIGSGGPFWCETWEAIEYTAVVTE